MKHTHLFKRNNNLQRKKLSLHEYFKSIKLYCDEEPDRSLFQKLKKLSLSLDKIQTENMTIYPQLSAAKNIQNFEKILPVFELDRPDFIFTFNQKPILILELTEHAYTGDNGLQRFTRVANAAEHKVPFVYFGPLSRVRDDELDATDDPSTLSKRSLTSDFFEGMRSLFDLYKAPQLFCEWKTGENGKVIKVSYSASAEDFMSVYGELISLIEKILIAHFKFGFETDKYISIPLINEAQKTVFKHAENKNTLFSDVKLHLDKTESIKIIENPPKLMKYLGNYFFKGKPDKLLSYFSLLKSEINTIYIGNKKINDKKEILIILKKIFSLPFWKNGAFFYFSGYKWRSDPHCGVAINLYYRKCIKEGKLILPLILIYPRISTNLDTVKSLTYQTMRTDDLKNIFKKRYKEDYENKFSKVIKSDNLFHVWSDSTKQARIFKRYCAMIICNDGIILGQEIENKLK